MFTQHAKDAQSTVDDDGIASLPSMTLVVAPLAL